MNPDAEFDAAPVRYRDGTYRTCPPEQTWATVRPLLPRCGITRVADVTRLDRPGIATCCAIRPTATVMQVANGKGTTPAAARVSAAMESIELFHAEQCPPTRLHMACERDLDGAVRPVEHRALPSFRSDRHYDDRLRIGWMRGWDAHAARDVWVPAGAVCFDQEPSPHVPTSNGLASGNHPLEARLHALYELIERDAGARLSAGGRIDFGSIGVIDADTVDAPPLRALIDALCADSRLVVMEVESVVAVSTFWAVLLNARAHSALTRLNIGWGTHASRHVALSRALTEAAQARLTHIHGAREDIVIRPGFGATGISDSPAWRVFSRMRPNRSWAEARDRDAETPDDLGHEWRRLLAELASRGVGPVVTVDLTRADIGLPVVKVLAPGLRFNPRMF